jgi:hypothetical protein
VDAPEGAPTIKTFPPETQAFMKAALHQFSVQDPRWESTRREWLAMGPRETEFLVQTMWGGLLASQKRNAPELVERARHELALIGEPSIPLMADVIATGEVGTAYDPGSSEQRPVRVDDMERREAAEVLAIIGPSAVAPTIAALDRAQTKSGKRAALAALGNMGDRGGAEAAGTLVAWSRAEELLHRVEAVSGMRNYTDGATRSALLAALSDEDEIVRIKAAESLWVRKDTSASGAIHDAAERARSQGHLGEANKLERIAGSIGRAP